MGAVATVADLRRAVRALASPWPRKTSRLRQVRRASELRGTWPRRGGEAEPGSMAQAAQHRSVVFLRVQVVFSRSRPPRTGHRDSLREGEPWS